MKNVLLGTVIAAVFTMLLLHVLPHVHSIVHAHSIQQVASDAPPIQVENSFDFAVHGDFAQIAPLFGGYAERAWGGDQWRPHFVYPQPPHDVPGEVFTTAHGHNTVYWVNTAMDLDAGHFQYVYVMPDFQTTVIDVHLTRSAKREVAVHVTYKRTALQSQLNDHIVELGNKDRESGKEWQTGIQAFLDRKK